MNQSLSPLCVYCGSATGANPAYAAGARNLGRAMAARGVELIYGGGRAGLMGIIADAVLEAGGRVTGVITQQLVDKELAHNGCHDLRVVDTMHERKKLMADAARGFIALPGGVGTLDELFEILAWAQLGIHDHPVGLLNVEGYFDGLLAFLARAQADRFMRVDIERALLVDPDPAPLLDRMAAAPALVRRAHGAEQ